MTKKYHWKHILKTIAVWCCILCFALSFPSVAYRTLGFFVANTVTFVPHSSFTTTQKGNMRSSLTKWNQAAGETILALSSSTHSRSGFGNYLNDGRCYVFCELYDDENLAMCAHPSSNGVLTESDIVMNTFFDWGGTNGYDFYSIFLHESGHTAGLNHSNDDEAVMWGGFAPGEQRRTLNDDDLAGMEAIYYWNWQ